MAGVRKVALVPASNWIGMPIPSIRIEWDGDSVKLHSSAYSLSGLENVAARLAERGIAVDPAVWSWIESRKKKKTAPPQ